jgi:hypothetical protein
MGAIHSPELRRSWFVATVTVGLATWVWWLMRRYAGRFPYYDDFAYFTLQVFPDSLTWHELWSPLNEHRFALPKLVTWAISRLGGYHPKWILDFNLGFLILATILFMRSLKAVRGHWRMTDITIPLIVYSWGQAENFLWPVQVNFLLPTALSLLALAIVIHPEWPRSTWRLALVVGLAILLALCGISGQITAAALAAGLVAWGVSGAGLRSRAGVLALSCGALVLGFVAFTVSGIPPVEHHEPWSYSTSSLRYVIRVLGAGWGPAPDALAVQEPCRLPSPVGLVTLILVVVSLTRLARNWQRFCELAPLGVAAIVMAGGIALARAEQNQGQLAYRYITLFTPLLLWLLAVDVRLSAGPWLARGMFAVTLVFFIPNFERGQSHAVHWDARQFRLAQDIERGVPIPYLVEHHGHYFCPPNPKAMIPILETLRNESIPPFAKSPREARVTTRAVAWRMVRVPTSEKSITWSIPPGELGQAVIEFDPPPEMKGVIFRYRASKIPAPSLSQIRWEESAEPKVIRHYWDPFPEATRSEKAFWTGKPIGRFDLQFAGPTELEIESVTVLIE